jgi:UDP-GlcNAc:undecaprenyl-phosphate GlcNAc-1-phosphate transferase
LEIGKDVPSRAKFDKLQGSALYPPGNGFVTLERNQMDAIFLAVFISALFTSLVLVPPLSGIAFRFGGIDRIEARKVHLRSTPRLGGVAIFSGFLLAFLLFGDLDSQARGLLAGGIIIFLTGLADDFISLPPYCKFCGEVLAATIGVVMGGLSLASLGNPLGFGEIELGIFAVPFSVFAVVGVINAINLLDGLDGLAGGVSALACIAFGVLAYKTGNSSLMFLSVALLGGVLGFLRYNTYPAKVFMGDSGSLFIGYCLAFFSIKLVVEGHGAISPAIPLIILGVPVVDTLVVMVNRLRKGEKIFLPDKTHIHHRLLDLGIGHKFCVFLVYGLTYLLCFSAVIFYHFAEYNLLVSFLIATALFYGGVNYLSRAYSRKVDGKPVRNRLIRTSVMYRKVIARARSLVLVIKYLLIAILLLSITIPHVQGNDIELMVSCLLLLLTCLLFSIDAWGNMLFQFVLYFNAAFIIFMMENYGGDVTIFGIPMLDISNYLFLLLFLVEGVKIYLRKNSGKLIHSPFEYFILFMVISVPLLPTELSGQYHLLTVAGKSVILFIAYKLILMHQIRQNRKIVFATGTALFAFSLRFLGLI